MSDKSKSSTPSTLSLGRAPPPIPSKPQFLPDTNNNNDIVSESPPSTSGSYTTNWMDLKSKMNQFDKSDLKRGSILIEHLSEYNKMASSQVILGEEIQNNNDSNNNSNRNSTISCNSNSSGAGGELETINIQNLSVANNSNNTNNISNSTGSTATTSSSTTTNTTTTTVSSSNNNTNNTTTSNNTATPATPNKLPMSQATIDSLVLSGVTLFNEKPKKGIEHFIQHKLLEKTPESVSEFLHECPLLDKKSIGDYLGDNDPFCILVLESLIARFNFRDLDFDMSLRQLLYSFRLPGEAQKIDRVVQRFANQYHKDNLVGGFIEDPDTVYTLAFAIILLNTDLHNPVVKPTMTKSKFCRSLSKINSGKDLPAEFLEDMFDRILVDEIKMNPSSTLFPYAVKKGWLNIRVKGKVTDKWSRKWCVLSDGTLYFFRKPTDQSPVRYLRPDTVITSKKEIKGRKNCFMLNHSSPPITLENLIKSTQKSKAFNPQVLLQQLALFGKEKEKVPRFWDSASEKHFGNQQQQQQMDLMQDILDTDSVSSMDTLSETSSTTNYFDDDYLSPSSSVSSSSTTSPTIFDQQSYDPMKKGFLRSKNGQIEVEGKFKNGTQTLSRPPSTKHTHYNPNFNTIHPISSTSSSSTTTATTTTNNNNNSNNSTPNYNSPNTQSTPPQQTATTTNPNPAVNHYFKTVQSSSLIRSSSISTFSTPNNPNFSSSPVPSSSPNHSQSSLTSSNSSVASSNQNSPAGSAYSTPTTTTTTSTSNNHNNTSSPARNQLPKTEYDKNYEKNLDAFMKLQEKMIKASKNTNTCILNTDTQREMDSWIRLILHQFNKK